MIIQIYTENALKHGIFHLEGDDGLILISLSGNDRKLLVEITDNGVGREFTRLNKSGSTGKGTQIMQQYSELINKSYTDKIGILSEDLYNISGKPAGTRVRIEIVYD
jgi:LytS/YehU family sensor histidine kinase